LSVAVFLESILYFQSGNYRITYSYYYSNFRTTVDYFSLDVEGNELDILRTIPFDKINIKVKICFFVCLFVFGRWLGMRPLSKSSPVISEVYPNLHE
jgi:hypothetical protein